MKRSIRYIALFALLLLVVAIGTGCGRLDEPPHPGNGFWQAFFVYPLYWLLIKAHGLLFNEWGLAILVITVIVRLLILPLNIKQYKSTKAMQALQPEIQMINTKYKDNPQKRQEETMKLFQKSGINPMAGCLPLLIQMPILFAFYQAIIGVSLAHNPGEILEGETFSFLWIENLSASDPFYVLPVLAALSTFFQMRMSMLTTAQANPQQQQQIKLMSIIMPLFILFIGISLPAALALYWVFGTVFSIVQTYFLYDIKNVRKQQKEQKLTQQTQVRGGAKK